MARPDEDITDWAGRLERAIERIDAQVGGQAGSCCVSEVFVYQRVSSTQDAAHRHRDPGGGVLAVASDQTAGRGRLGRRWDDGQASTLPMSIALRTELDDVGLAARAGLAALDACADRCPDAGVLIKWPNDVIVRAGASDRKLAGVLIERRDGFAIIGIGVNVFEGASADEEPGASAPAYDAISFEDLGITADRCDLAIGLIDRLSYWLDASDGAVRARWGERDAMLGTRRGFNIDGETVEGTVIAIDPLSTITLRTKTGDRSLPVATIRTV